MREYLAEVIGTFALVFCGTGAIIYKKGRVNSVVDGRNSGYFFT